MSEIPSSIQTEIKQEPTPIIKYSLSDTQLNRAAEFLTDLAKLSIASVFVGFFIPQSTGFKISTGALLIGTFAALLLFSLALRLTPSSKI